MLAAWLAHVKQMDPDAFYLYQVPPSVLWSSMPGSFCYTCTANAAAAAYAPLFLRQLHLLLLPPPPPLPPLLLLLRSAAQHLILVQVLCTVCCSSGTPIAEINSSIRNRPDHHAKRKDDKSSVDKPHVHVGMQVKDTLGAIAARFKALHIGGGGLFVGRLTGPHARPLTLKSVVRYSPNWVKNQNRMASTSNQETYRTDVDGRLVFDILRQVCLCDARLVMHGSL